MKKLFLISCLCLMVSAAFGQAKKPRLMVVPSDSWCYQNGYMQQYDNQGVIEYIPDYKRALVECSDLIPVISAINGLMADRDFPLDDLQQTMASINRQQTELAAVTNKSGDASVKSNDLMELRQRARCDIILELTWTVNHIGPKQSITYTLRALDAYTNNEVASAGGTGDPSNCVVTATLLTAAVNAHMDLFCTRLQDHFDDLLKNGRAIALNINVFDNDMDIDLETEYDGYELREIIEDWVYENTVSGRYNLIDDNELYMAFDDVRIPVYDDRDRPIAANNFARDLARFLKGEPYNIELIKVMNQGLGQATVIIGNK